MCLPKHALHPCTRWLVFTVFPIFLTSVIVVKGVVLFKRGIIRDKQVGGLACKQGGSRPAAARAPVPLPARVALGGVCALVPLPPWTCWCHTHPPAHTHPAPCARRRSTPG